MADIQDNHSPEEPTRKVTDFPEVKDKMVNSVEVFAETEGFGITIRFHDETTLNFSIEPCLVVFPAYAQWEKGEETVVKRWQPITSAIHDS